MVYLQKSSKSYNQIYKYIYRYIFKYIIIVPYLFLILLQTEKILLTNKIQLILHSEITKSELLTKNKLTNIIFTFQVFLSKIYI